MTQQAPPPTSTDNAEATFERRMSAVTASIRKYHSYLEAYLTQLTRQHQDAEDLAQELWTYVLLHFKEEQIGSLPLLRRKAYHLFIDQYRKQIRRGETPTDTIPDLPVASNAQEAYSEEEEASLKANFWAEYPDIDLTEEQKEVLWLHARYGFTYKEIHQQTNIPESTISDWVRIGRTRLTEANNH